MLTQTEISVLEPGDLLLDQRGLAPTLWFVHRAATGRPGLRIISENGTVRGGADMLAMLSHFDRVVRV